MIHLIDKDILDAEIEKLKKNEGWCQVGKDTADVYYTRGFRFACERIISFLESLEVKEVDLEKEIYDAEKRFGDIDEMGGYRILIFDYEFRDILRHFFELGLKAQKGE